MAAPIGPGDWVECVDVRRRDGANGPPQGIAPGRIYSVAATGISAGHAVLLLAEVRSQHPTGRYRADHFRPIYRPKSEIIEALKAPVTRTPRPAKKSRETV